MMRSLKKFFTIAVLMNAMLFILGAAQASTLTLPADTKVIEEEAFYGDTSLDEVVLPDRIKRIESKAFSKSSVKKINLPDSVEFIAEDAFDAGARIRMTATRGTPAYEWAVRNGFIKDTQTPLEYFEFEPIYAQACKIVAYKGPADLTDLVIPSEDGHGRTVVEIGSSAFAGYSELSGDLIIPDTVEVIGESAFSDCYGFTGELIIPDSVIVIEAGAFCNCYGFTGELTIPNQVNTIGDLAFSFCEGLTGDLIIPDSVNTIGDLAFSDCTGFDGKLVLPRYLSVLNIAVFSNCSGFTGDLFIPNGVNEIRDSAFYACSGFDGIVVIPYSMDSIGETAFTDTGFTEAYLPSALNDIADDAFDSDIRIIAEEGSRACVWARERSYSVDPNPGDFTYGLLDHEKKTCVVTGYSKIAAANLVIPSRSIDGYKVRAIQNRAFYNHSQFSGSLTIPDGVTEIGANAFYHCGFTGTLTIPDSVTVIEYGAFDGCHLFSGNLALPDNLITIESNAFNFCRGFTGNLVIPDSVTSIGHNAFFGCSGFNGSLSISKNITTIEDEAFSWCSGLKGDLIIPESVVKIGKSAFYGCSNFNGNLVIPDSVNVIGKDAFNGCSSLKGDLVIPAGITSIEDKTFFGCSGFDGCLTIPNGVISIGTDAFNGCKKITGNLVIPNSVNNIGNSAFGGCSSFTGSLRIPDNVTRIGSGTFSECSGFTGNLILPANLNSIGDMAFYYCNGFTGSLTIPDKVEEIDAGAFSNCSNFTGNLIIPDSVTYIGPGTFDFCNGFNGFLKLSSNITSIQSCTFRDCSGLTGRLAIPGKVEFIENSAFEGCGGFNSLVIGDKVDSFGSDVFHIIIGFQTKELINFDPIYCPESSYAWEYFVQNGAEDKLIPWDCDYASLPEEYQLFGDFTDDSITLTLGEPNKIPAGYVKSIGQNIYRISITVAGYEMDDPVNNRYATDVFVDHHTKEINLTDWGAFYLDTTRAPFNVPGTYTIELWANVEGGEEVKLDSMTVYVGWKGYNGTVYTSGGDPLEGVSVFISRADAPSNVLMALTTNRYGSWQSTALSDGYDYTVEFYYSDYEFNTYTSTSYGEKVFTTIGQLSGSHAADACQFEIKQEGEIVSSATVGTELVFEVTAPGATHVKLVVDDIVYDSYYLNDGKGVFKRAITKSGDRRVKLIAYNNSQSIGISAEKVISILSNGDLNPPSITSILAATAGENYQLTWNPVENADQYTIYMYHETNLMHIWKTDNNQIVISGNHIYEEGNYFLEIIASGIGYSQKSGTGNLIAAKNPNEKDLSGTIIDQNNQPINAADVYLIKSTWNAWVFLNQVQTDDNGNFRFEDLTPNCSYSLFWIKDGYSAENEYIKTEAGKQLTLIGKELGDGPLYLSVPGITHWKDANEQVVIVYSPGPWNAFTTENWITTAVGSNENELHIYMTENISGAERSGSIFITSGTHQVVLPVVQQAGDSLMLISKGAAQNVTKLGKGDACKFLNFLFGDGAVEGRLGGVFGWKVQEKIYDYWRVLIGDTKKLTSSEIISIKKRLLALAESRLLIMSNGVLSADQISHATKAIQEYHAEGYISDYDLESGVEDLIDNIDIEDIEIDLAGSFDPTLLMDAHLWNQWCAGASLIENNRRMNSAKQLLYELDENRDPLMRNLYYNEVRTNPMDAYLDQDEVKKFSSILNTYLNEVRNNN